jgi:hypothetical protein
MMRARVAAVALALAAQVTGGDRAARADGAFPDSLSVLVPADRPHHVALATNFGLISSDDDGGTWTWVCEGALTNCSMLYSVGAAPGDRLFALSADSLVYSDDDACDWSVAVGVVASGGVVDAFPLPQDAQRVLAVVSPNGVNAQTTYTVVASSDGGATFSSVIYTAASGDIVTGVEAARGDASTIYVTLATGMAFSPALAVTSDGGGTWRTVDLSPTLGGGGVRLIGVDRTNAGRVFLRASLLDAEVLAVFDAGTGAVTMPLTFPGGLMTAFVQTAEGPLVAAGRIDNDAAVHRSLDGGASWQTVAGAPHLRALAERAGTLYAAADDTADGYALGASTDLGLTFRPLMRFDQVSSIATCVRASCRATCLVEAGLHLWPASMCDAAPAVKASGGGCQLAPSSAGTGGGLLLTLGLLARRRARATTGRTRAITVGRTGTRRACSRRRCRSFHRR